MTDRSNFTAFTARLRQFMVTGALLPDSDSGSQDPIFNALALELFPLQFKFNTVFRQLCSAQGVSPATLTHWTEIPAVPTSAFKVFELTCLPVIERTTVFHSSGTTGHEPSRHFHSAESLALYEASLWPWFKEHLLADAAKPNVLILTPASAQAPHSSLAHMFQTVRQHLGGAACCGAVGTSGAWSLDVTAVTAAVESATESGRPLLVLGTAFNFVHLLDHLAASGRRYRLPAGSRVLETGGYKGRSRSMPKPELQTLIVEWLGVPTDHIICEYGMSELSSQAYDTAIPISQAMPRPARVFQFPSWARVRIVSPETGGEVADGETGLIQVFDLANVWSVLAIQTEDLVIRRERGFELLGRAVAVDPRGCSLMSD